MNWRATLALAATLGLSGCATLVENVSGTQDSRVLNPDGVQGNRGQSSTTGRSSPANPAAADRLRGATPDMACAGGAKGTRFAFFCRQQAAERDGSSPEDARQYLAAGLTLSNELCDAWFTRLQVTQVTLRQTSDVISSVGSVTAAIMGFTQTPSKTIGLTASLFGAAKQANDNLAANYIVAADLTSVASAVREYRALYAQQIDQSQATWNYYTARRVIMAYDNTCSAIFVRRFVNARIEGGKGDDREVTPLLEAAIAAFVTESGRYFAKPLTVGQLVDLYAYLYLTETPQPTRDKLAEGLRADQLLNDQGVVFRTKDGQPAASVESLARMLIAANIDEAIRTRARARVEAVRGVLAAEAQAKAKTAEKAEATAKDDAAKAVELAAAADIKAQAAASAVAEANAARAKVTALSVELQAAPDSAATKLIQEATDADAKAARLQDEADKERAKATAAANTAAQSAITRDQAQAAADRAAKDLAGAATGASRATLDAERAAAPVPSGPNGRPLDAPPKP